MKRSVIFILFIVVAVTGLLFGGKYFSHSRGTAAAGSSEMAGGPASPGKIAPDFELKVLDGPDGPGKTLQLSSLRGKAVLVNVWATYCEPCKKEMPWLVELQNKYGPQGFQILGVAQDEASEKAIVDFAHKMGLNYPILKGDDHINDNYPSDGLPLSVYIDRSGKIVFRAVGLVGASKEAAFGGMEDAVKKALAGGATTASTK